MAKMLDLIRMAQRGQLPPPAVATLIGFALTAVEPGRAVVEFTAEARHANPMGTLQGAAGGAGDLHLHDAPRRRHHGSVDHPRLTPGSRTPLQ